MKRCGLKQKSTHSELDLFGGSLSGSGDFWRLRFFNASPSGDCSSGGRFAARRLLGFAAGVSEMITKKKVCSICLISKISSVTYKSNILREYTDLALQLDMLIPGGGVGAQTERERGIEKQIEAHKRNGESREEYQRYGENEGRVDKRESKEGIIRGVRTRSLERKGRERGEMKESIKWRNAKEGERESEKEREGD